MKIRLGAIWTLGVAACAIGDDQPIVQGPMLEKIIGVTKKVEGVKYDAFYGIRYAYPPVGERRFQLPEIVKKYKTLKTGVRGYRCKQPLMMDVGQADRETSEDCLNLNIFRKQGTTGSDRKAVIVIIHDGWFSFGSNNDAPFVGGPLAALGDVVSVSVNYRLNVLGFVYLANAVPGNLGLWDQQAALVWIHTNIAAFGGDPNKVTIMGTGAGSMSINAHLVSQSTKPLFQAAIMDAGVMDRAFVSSSAENIYRLGTLGCSLRCWPEDLEAKKIKPHALFHCLNTSYTPDVITSAVDLMDSPVFTFFPSGDGVMLPLLNDSTSWNASNFHKVRIMIGYSADEGSLFSQYYVDRRKTVAPTGDAAIKEHLRELARGYRYKDLLRGGGIPETVYNEIRKSYRISAEGGFEKFANFVKDGSFACPINAFIKSYARSNKPMYVYHFEKVARSTWFNVEPELFGAHHATSFSHFTGAVLDDELSKVTAEDKQYIKDAIQMVAAFARGETPSFRGVKFPDFSNDGKILRFPNTGDLKPIITDGLLSEKECKAVFSHYDKAASAE